MQGVPDNSGPAKVAPQRNSELMSRLLSAAVLAVVALGLTYAGAWPFALLLAVFGGAMCWEWGRIVRGTSLDVPLAIHVLTMLLAIFAVLQGYGVGAVIAILGGGVVAGLPIINGGDSCRGVMSSAGVAYICLPVAGLVWLRGDEVWGWQAILFVFVIVWSADTFAYFAGRTFGGAKLWPAISPNKSWSGFFGGVAGGGVAALLMTYLLGGMLSVQTFCLGLMLAVAGQLGDLAESGLKRSYGVKDSSQLIPGHGGVLDRVDGLIFAALAACVFALLVGPAHPGSALLN